MSNYSKVYKTTIKHPKAKSLAQIYIHIPDDFKDEHEPDKNNLIKEFVKVLPFSDFKNDEEKPTVLSIKKLEIIPEGSFLFVYEGKKTFTNKNQPSHDEEFIHYLSHMKSNQYSCVKVTIEADMSTGSIMFSKHVYTFECHVAKA